MRSSTDDSKKTKKAFGGSQSTYNEFLYLDREILAQISAQAFGGEPESYKHGSGKIRSKSGELGAEVGGADASDLTKFGAPLDETSLLAGLISKVFRGKGHVSRASERADSTERQYSALISGALEALGFCSTREL